MSDERHGFKTLMQASTELRGLAALPPGIREADSWYFDERDSEAIFVPDAGRWPSSLREVADLGDLLEPVPDANVPTPIEVVANGNVDQLAWYQTFRNPVGWGIHVRETGIDALSQSLAGSDSEKSHHKEAFHALYLHEYAHFLFDVAAVVVEDIIGGPIYEQHRGAIITSPLGYDAREEALCNAFALRHTATAARVGLRRFLRNAPEGYRDFDKFRSASTFAEGVEQTIGEMLHGLGGRSAVGASPLFDGRGASVAPYLVPIYLDRDSATRPLLTLITALSNVQQSPKFARELRKLPIRVQSEWIENVEPMLHTDVGRCQFKALTGRPNVYSVRVGRTYRAILERSENSWTAVEITHRKDAYR